MPFAPLTLKPGVDVERTPVALRAGYFQATLMRFRSGLAEKLGGWQKFYAFAVGGVPRALHAWQDFDDDQHLAVGTTSELDVITDDQNSVITPQTYTSNIAPAFDTSIGSDDVTINDTNIANVTTFDTIELLTPISVGGLILSGAYPISVISGTSDYQIVAAANATGAVTNGGAVPVFVTTSGASSVSVTLADHGLSVGGTIVFPIDTPITVAGNDTYCKVLLHMDGADASTTFTDSNAGGSAHTWTANGNAQLDTAQYKFGTASGLFDGTGDYVTTPDHADFTLGSGDWTADCWFNVNAAGGTQLLLCGQSDNAATATTIPFYIERHTTNVIRGLAVVGGSSFVCTGTTQFTNAVNTGWHHVAFVRTGNTLKLFIDGVQEGSDTAISGTVNDSSNAFSIGRLGELNGSYWNGWIDEFRLSVGIARWTADFDPPEAEYGTSAFTIYAGNYPATSITSSSIFVIAAANTAPASTTVRMNQGLARIVYYIGLGPTSGAGTAYSFGTYSSGPYSGLGGGSGSAQTGTAITTTDWTLDNWAETLLACPANSGIYEWTPGTGFQTAKLIGTAPIYNSGIFVANPYQAVVAYGSTVEKDIGVDQDPLTYNISDLNDYTYWIPNTTNPNTGIASQAYQNRIPRGSAIKAGLATAQQILLWTDLGLWRLSYMGLPAIWTQDQIGDNCGTVSRHSVGAMGGVVYWMGRRNFHALAGSAPAVIPCSVWDAVFQSLDNDNLANCWVETVTSFNEVFWFYPSSSSMDGQCDSYVKVNVLDGAWDYGSLPRSAGIDQSVLGDPIMATPTGIIYQHEQGYDADGQPLVPTMVTGFFYLSEGEEFVFADQFYPDFKYEVYDGSTTSATVQVTFTVKDYPGDTARTYGPYSMTTDTLKLDIRIRGRMFQFTMTSSDVGSFWRLGRPYFRIAQSGRR